MSSSALFRFRFQQSNQGISINVLLPNTPDSLVQYGASSAQTTVIPLLEREERALRDARAGLDGYDSEGNPLAESSTSSK